MVTRNRLSNRQVPSLKAITQYVISGNHTLYTLYIYIWYSGYSRRRRRRRRWWPNQVAQIAAQIEIDNDITDND